MTENDPNWQKNVNYLIWEFSGKMKISQTKLGHLIVKQQKIEEKIKSYMQPKRKAKRKVFKWTLKGI